MSTSVSIIGVVSVIMASSRRRDRRLGRPFLRQPTFRQCIGPRRRDDEADVDDLQPFIGRGLAVALVVLGLMAYIPALTIR